MEMTEVNTDGWESEKEAMENQIFMNPNGDSPFQILKKQRDEELTPEEKEDKKTSEIIDMF